MIQKTTDFQRFNNLLKRNPATGCWEWIGAKQKSNKGHLEYGIFRYEGRSQKANRVAWRLYRGPIPFETPFVLHSCNNSLCVNPDHLHLGTVQDSSDEMVRQGRSSRGTDRHTAKLTEDNVREIRRLYETGMLQIDIAKKFDIGQSNVTMIINKKRWGWVE